MVVQRFGIVVAALAVIALPAIANAQARDMGGTCPHCPGGMMMGPLGVLGMILFALLVVALIVALGALAYFLVRRSLPPSRGPA